METPLRSRAIAAKSAGMPKRRKPAARFDPEGWASTSEAPWAHHRCVTCAKPEWRDVVRRVLKTWAAGRGAACASGLHHMMVERYGYTWTYSALQRHLRECEKALWSKVTPR